jgi:hypothetical protein
MGILLLQLTLLVVCFHLMVFTPSPRGYAVIANLFSTAINTTYQSTLPMIDLSLYRILYPASL